MASLRRPFYIGENINLVIPTKEHVEHSSWTDWFNSQITTAHTTHGIFPNFIENQHKFLDDLSSGQRLALLIENPIFPQNPIGIVSLSSIDLRKQTAAIAIIMDTETSVPHSPLASLEAMAALTSHGFDVLGLRRIDAGQVFPALARWNRLLELLAFRTEGFKRQAFRRGHEVMDEVVMGALYEDYQILKQKRSGKFWPGSKEIKKEIAELPKSGYASVLYDAITLEHQKYFNQK